MEHTDLIAENGIVFDAKPDSIPYNYRISYKVSQICMIIKMCSSVKSGCSPVKLHMISLALASQDVLSKLLDYVQDEFSVPPIVRFDPAVNRALSYAIADNLISQSPTGKYVLTDRGLALTDQIENDVDTMVSEKIDLLKLSKKLTESKIKQLSDMWREAYAEN